MRFVNESTHPRQEWGLATVPFPQGVFRTGDTFGVVGHPAVLVPFGSRWPDGSVRFAQLDVLVELAAGQEKLITVREGVQPYAGPFTPSDSLVSRLPSFGMTMLVGLPDGSSRRASLQSFRTIRRSAARESVHARARIPGTDFVIDAWFDLFDRQDGVRFEMRLTNSDATSVEWVQEVEYVALEVSGALPSIRGAIRHRILGQATSLVGPTTLLLLGQTTFFDGQAYEWWGDLAFLDPSLGLPDLPERLDNLRAILHSPLFGVATNWRSSGAFGPFGVLAEPPPWILDEGRAAALDERAEFLTHYTSPGTPFEDRPKALQPYAAATGNQDDYGVGKFVEVFASAMPQGVEEARYVGGEEAHRPVHHREADGSIVRATNRPQWISRDGRTHWSNSVSVDRLGKPYPALSPRGLAHNWTGKDNQHWSSLRLAGAYLLTGSHSLAHELEVESELYMSSHTRPGQRPGMPSNSIGNGRAIGRTLLSMSWNYLLTARLELRDHVRGRVTECILPQHFGIAAGGSVRPIRVSGPDARTIASGDWWSPWEEGQAVMGLEACYEVFGSADARTVADVVARNFVEHGWRLDFDRTVVGFAQRYLVGGQPLPPSWLSSLEHTRWAGPLFKEWSLPALRLARRSAIRQNDALLLSRTELLLDHVEGQREPPRVGADWDSYAAWDCVR